MTPHHLPIFGQGNLYRCLRVEWNFPETAKLFQVVFAQQG
jgi:hypothetical protein